MENVKIRLRAQGEKEEEKMVEKHFVALGLREQGEKEVLGAHRVIREKEIGWLYYFNRVHKTYLLD